jgi:serine/threonine protein kinase
LTDTGQVIGTLRYLAPEVARGRPATRRSDLYSLGVLLSEVATGDQSPGLVRLIDRLTQADPANRPPSAERALSALEGPTRATAATRPLTATLATRPLASTLPTRPLIAKAPQHRRTLLATGLVLALAAVIVVIVIATSGGGGKSSASTVRAAPANAPLSRQLSTLDHMVGRDSGQ